MDKKGTLIANTIILEYSFIILAFVAVGFLVLFVILSSSEYIPGAKKQPGFNIVAEKIETDIVDPYTALNYYLYTKIKVDKKETNLLELISLYCYNYDEKISANLKEISKILLPEGGRGVHIACPQQKCEVEESVFGFKIEAQGNYLTLGASLLSPEAKLVELPSISKKNHACLLFGENKYKAEFYIDSSYSEKEFEEKVKQKSLFKKAIGKNNYLISPSRDLWLYSGNIWCNPLKQAGLLSDCSKGISSQELINCKGDYEVCKK